MRIDRIKFATELAKADISVNSLAQRSGLSRVTVSSVKCGKTCSQKTAVKIASALGVDVTALIDGVNCS